MQNDHTTGMLNPLDHLNDAQSLLNHALLVNKNQVISLDPGMFLTIPKQKSTIPLVEPRDWHLLYKLFC